MDILQQALQLIEKGNIATFFDLAEKNGIRSTEQDQYLLYLKQTQTALTEQMRLFAQAIFPQESIALPQENNAHILTQFVPITGTILSRQDMLNRLHQHLQTTLPAVIVQEQSGVGKTTLARQYATHYLAHYAHLIYLEQTTSLIHAFARNPHLNEGLPFQQEPEIARFKRVLDRLAQIQGNNLLIIDNYNRTEEDEQRQILACLREPRLQHWRILFTSRKKVQHKDFKEVRLGILPEEEAIVLFRLHSQTKPTHEKELKDLLKTIQYHTLMIVLLSKIYAQRLDIENLSNFCLLLPQKSKNSPTLQQKNWAKNNQVDIQLYTYLEKAFELSSLSEAEHYILRQLAVLPAMPLKKDDILDWIGDNTHTYEQVLFELAQKGWIAYHETHAFEMHSLIQTFILNHLKPTIAQCKILFDKFITVLDISKNEDDLATYQEVIKCCEALLAGIHFEAEPFWKALLQTELANFYRDLGINMQAERLYQASLLIIKEALGTKHGMYIKILDNLADLYKIENKYDKAIASYKEILQIMQQTIGKKNEDYITNLSKIAYIYQMQNKYKEAQLLYEEGLEINKEVVGTHHIEYAINLNNLALVYKKQSKYVEAEALYKKALQIDIKIVGKQHHHYALHLHNLGSMYYKMKRYTEAQEIFTEAYNIQMTILGEQDSATQSTKEWLEAVHAKLLQ